MLGHRLNTHSADYCSFVGVLAPPSLVSVFGEYGSLPTSAEARRSDPRAPDKSPPAFLPSDLQTIGARVCA
jgi:hypothetical protein